MVIIEFYFIAILILASYAILNFSKKLRVHEFHRKFVLAPADKTVSEYD